MKINNYNWNIKNSPVRLLIKGMSKLSDRVEPGFFIAKQKIKIDYFSDINDNLIFQSTIEKSKHLKSMKYLLCSCKVLSKNKVLMQLHSTLIKKNNFKNSNVKLLDSTDMQKFFFKNITNDEVFKFSTISKDPNYIHKGEKPVVQGMLIPLLLEKHLISQGKYMTNCEITYKNPILAATDIFLCWKSSQNLMGIADNKLCFKLTFK